MHHRDWWLQGSCLNQSSIIIIPDVLGGLVTLGNVLWFIGEYLVGPKIAGILELFIWIGILPLGIACILNAVVFQKQAE